MSVSIIMRLDQQMTKNSVFWKRHLMTHNRVLVCLFPIHEQKALSKSIKRKINNKDSCVQIPCYDYIKRGIYIYIYFNVLTDI